MPSVSVILLGVLATIGALLYAPIRQRYVVLGFGRPASSTVNIHGLTDLVTIPGTIQCEDLHHEKTTNTLFAACQTDREHRAKWFTPLVIFTDPKATGEGAIVKVDPSTFKATTLKVRGSPGHMVTHGIDILNDPKDPSILWIYLVNHMPNPERWFADPPNKSASPERATIEIFRHVLGSDEAVFVRTVTNPLIKTPNDIFATSPTSFYVSNDHIHHEGLLRELEDMASQGFVPSTTVVHVKISDMETTDAAAGVTASIALDNVHQSNGLGWGSQRLPQEVCVIDAAGGVLTRTKRDLSSSDPSKLTVLERIQMETSLDNPSFFLDVYATPGNNASGYVLPGLGNAAKLGGDAPYLDRPIPSLVWHVRPTNGIINFEGSNEWDKRLIFQDNGTALRSASGAVMVGIDPAETKGKKQAWLFVTGFGSEAMVAAKVEL